MAAMLPCGEMCVTEILPSQFTLGRYSRERQAIDSTARICCREREHEWEMHKGMVWPMTR